MCVSGQAQGQVYPPALSNRFVDNIATVLDMGSSGASGCGKYGYENKAPNGSYTVVGDYFAAMNGAHNVSFNRSVCIDPDSDMNGANNWAIVNDVTTHDVTATTVR